MRITDPISLIGDRLRATSLSSAADLYPGNHGNNRPLHCQPWKRSIWPCPTQFVSLLSKMYYLTELGILLIQPTIAFTDNLARSRRPSTSEAHRYPVSLYPRSSATRYGRNQLHTFRKATCRLPYEGPSYLQTQRLHQCFATRFLRFFSASPPASR